MKFGVLFLFFGPFIHAESGFNPNFRPQHQSFQAPPAQNNFRPLQSQPQRVYGPPQNQIQQPQRVYGPPPSKQVLDSYRVPLRESQRQPQTLYGPPPSKQISAQDSYRPPLREPQRQPQTLYGPPPSKQIGAQDSYRPPLREPQRQPQTLYGPPPSKQIGAEDSYRLPLREPQSTYRPAPNQQHKPQDSYRAPLKEPQRQPQTVYGPPKQVGSIPSTSYGVPDNNIETFQTQRLPNQNPARFRDLARALNPEEEYQYLRNNYRTIQPEQQSQKVDLPTTNYEVPNRPNQNPDLPERPDNSYGAPSNQSPPIREPTNFRGNPFVTGEGIIEERKINNNNNVNVQRAVVRKLIPLSGKEQFDQNYLPVETTTPETKTVRSKRPRINTTTTTTTTEASINDDEEEQENPPVAVANAFAGRLILLQPDGRIQNVLYSRIKNEGDKPGEYTANYYFQNLQALPDFYSLNVPVIAVGK